MNLLVYWLYCYEPGQNERQDKRPDDEAKGKDVERLLGKDVRERGDVVVDPLDHVHVSLA